jgi:hypothetical protein
MIPPTDPAVAEAFAAFPPAIRRKAMALRRLILETAAASDAVGPIMETLKWGQPAYLTSASKSGTTIRIGWKKSAPRRYALHVHCQTNLIDTFRALFPDEFEFEGNRAIVFEESDEVATDALAICIAAALTYHRDKKSGPKN